MKNWFCIFLQQSLCTTTKGKQSYFIGMCSIRRQSTLICTINISFPDSLYKLICYIIILYRQQFWFLILKHVNLVGEAISWTWDKQILNYVDNLDFFRNSIAWMAFKIAILKIWWVKISSIKLWKEEKKPIKLVSPKELVPIWTKTSTTLYLFKSIFQLHVNSNFMSQYFS